MLKKMNDKFYIDYFKLLNDKVSACDITDLFLASNMILNVKQSKNKLFVVGNGGSASISSHVAVDFTKISGVQAVTFNESNLITCFANDYGYVHWVEKALEFYTNSGDMVILISSSGMSPNIINGAKKAKSMGLSVITLSGFSGSNQLRSLGDLNLWVDSSSYNIVEMTHHVWLVSIVDYLAQIQS
jgi:D-sedoheptulose 7-phosphate isomerase